MHSDSHGFFMTMKFKKFFLLLFLSLFTSYTFADISSPTIYQSGLLLNLANGILDGSTFLSSLLQRANFGLGTIQGGEGELIILDGKAYLGGSDGKARLIPNNILTPFAMAVN